MKKEENTNTTIADAYENVTKIRKKRNASPKGWFLKEFDFIEIDYTLLTIENGNVTTSEVMTYTTPYVKSLDSEKSKIEKSIDGFDPTRNVVLLTGETRHIKQSARVNINEFIKWCNEKNYTINN